MPTPVSDTFPLLRTVNVNVTVLPAAPVPFVTAPDFVSVIAGPWGIGTVAGAVALTVTPPGAVPDVDAVLTTEPEFTSPRVRVYVAVAVTDWPGASTPKAPGHAYVSADSPVIGSVMVTPVRVVLPLLRAENV